MAICVIPARGGSKRIPRKNIKEFHGKPMIQWSIEAAQASNIFTDIIISTDDDEIGEIAESLGALVPFKRPLELSDDYTNTTEVIAHASNWSRNQGLDAAVVCCLYATAPFVSVGAIREAYEQMQHTQSDYCFTATSFAFPIQRAIKVTLENRIEMFYPEHLETRSQDLEESYHDAGQFYWGKPENWVKEKIIFNKNSSIIKIPYLQFIDINYRDDWDIAKKLYKLKK